MTTRIRSRRGTAAEWTSANPVLAAGELGVETDTKKLKAGDGTTAWNALDYVVGEVDPADIDASVESFITDNPPPVANDAVTNVKVAAGAAISADKLADGTTNKVLLGTERTKLAALPLASDLATSLSAKLTKPANPSGPAVPVIASDGTVTTTLVSALGGGPGAAQLNERGDYTTAQATSAAFAIADVFTWQGVRYAVSTAFTGTSTPDLTKTIALGIDGDAAVELAADGAPLILGQQAAGPAFAFPSTGVVKLSGADVDADGNGTIPALLDDGREVSFLVAEFTIASGAPVDTGKPGAPTGLTATPGEEQVALTWTAPTDVGDSAITDYTVQYRIGAAAWSPFAHTAATTAARTVTGLTADTLYEFRVAAVNTQGTGAWSSPTASATPTAVLSLLQHDTFDRPDAGIIGVSTDGYSWDVTPLPNRDVDPSGATISAGWSIGIRDNQLATISQPGGGAYLVSRTAPDSTDAPDGWIARWRVPTNGTPFVRNIRYVACFVDDKNFLYVQGDLLRAMVGGTITSLGDGTGYGSLAGMVMGVEVSADRTQARLRIDASDDGGVSWPPSIRAWGTIPVGLRASRTVGVMTALLGGGTLPYYLTDEFWVAPA